MDEEYFTIAEVAEKLKVTPQAVYKWIKLQKITAVYAGADARITGAEIEAFIKRSTESRIGANSDKMGAQIHRLAMQPEPLATA